MSLRPCLDCGTPSRRARCPACQRPRPARPKLYDWRWRKLSRAARAAQPYCSECGATTDLTADHVVPLAAGGELHPTVVRVLCRPCNSRKGGGGRLLVEGGRRALYPLATSESESFARVIS
jgi:5-methylcytosine-specific restriction endonuclease McrA